MTDQSRPAVLPPAIPPDAVEIRPSEVNRLILVTLFKWRWLIVGVAVTLAIGAAVAMLLRPPRATAMAKLLIKSDRAALQLSGLPTPNPRPTTEAIYTEVELLQSRAVLVPAARSRAGSEAADRDIERDVEALRDNLDVTVLPNTNVIQVTYTTRRPADAEVSLRHIVDHYLEQHAAAYIGSTNLSTFYERETERASAALAAAETRLVQWQQANSVVAVESQIQNLLQTLGDMEANLKRTNAEVDATRAQIAALTRDIAALPRQAVTSQERVANPLVARLKSEIAAAQATMQDARKSPVTERLLAEISEAEVALTNPPASPLLARLHGDVVTAEVALHDLRLRYTDEDRRVREKAEQIAQLKNQIAAEERAVVTYNQQRLVALRRELASAEQAAAEAARGRLATMQQHLVEAERQGDVVGRETISLHPLRETLTRELGTARSRLTSLESQRDALQEHVRQATASLNTLRDKRVEADRLTREVESARGRYLANAKRLDDARLVAGLEKNQLSNVALIEAPHVSSAKSRWFRLDLVALAGLVGLGLGLVAALTLEFSNGSVRSREDVEFYLRLPVLASVPALPERGPSHTPPALEQGWPRRHA
ncbi:MAG TPA: Wzz/FepE/Etk N-terminal domain-containing protein [Candidatus Tectomicrobia bacterium]|nr:Wzz/FepE/Etk N-terminal domain-containing protein [Candidatus Tectomicrobia bacterium]